MKNYLKKYIKYVEDNKKSIDINELKIKIYFFQHERLIHLIITLFYALLLLFFLVLISLSYIFIIPAFILMIFVICYIIHYFFLENGVQYLYILYDEIKVHSIKGATKKK